MSALLEFGYEDMGLSDIYALCHKDNIWSRKVIEKLGFRYIGIISELPTEYDYYNNELLYRKEKA